MAVVAVPAAQVLFPVASGKHWERIEGRPSTGIELLEAPQLARLLQQKAGVCSPARRAMSRRFQRASTVGSIRTVVGGGGGGEEEEETAGIVRLEDAEWAPLPLLELTFDHFVRLPDAEGAFRPALPWRVEGGAMTSNPIPWRRGHPALRERTLLLIAEQVCAAQGTAAVLG